VDSGRFSYRALTSKFGGMPSAIDRACPDFQSLQAAEKLGFGVILSEAKNLSWI
jgi:hypothetical protein